MYVLDNRFIIDTIELSMAQDIRMVARIVVRIVAGIIWSRAHKNRP